MSKISYTERWKVDLPEGTSGKWSIEHFEVGKQDAAFEALRSVVTGSGRGVREGKYTALKYDERVIMSDTPDEMRDHSTAISEAERRGGHVLINGLGLGMVAAAMLDAEVRCPKCQQYPHHGDCSCVHIAGEPNFQFSVDKVTVIENSPDVIALVGPTLMKRYSSLLPRLEIIEADAFTYKPPKGIRYSVVWHDVWGALCTDSLKEIGTLHRRYGRRCDWQGSWGKELLLHRRRQERNHGW